MKAAPYFLMLTAALALSACNKELGEVNLAPTCKDQKVISAAQGQGVVLFDQREQAYTIHYSVPGSIDSKIVGFICGELPSAFRQDSLEVSFTGSYLAFDKYASPIGGEEYYYLSLSQIARVTGE